MNVPTINEALQAIRVVHNFYEATSENVQLICDLEAETNYRFLQCLSVNESTVPTLYVLCFVIATLRYNNIIPLGPLIAL